MIERRVSETGKRPAILAVDQALEWAYRDEKVERAYYGAAGLQQLEAEASGLTRHGWSTDGIVDVQRIAELGCRVQSSGAASRATDHTPPDAIALFEAVRRQGERGRAVAEAARTGEPPAWDVGRLRAVPALRPRPNGRAATLQTDREGWHYCPITWINTDGARRMARQAWRDWWETLEVIRADLDGRTIEDGGLATMRLGPPSVPPAPWEIERAIARSEMTRGPDRLLTPDQIDELERLKAEGATRAEISAALGLSANQVKHQLQRLTGSA